MNLKSKTAADPNLSRVVHGPSNVSSIKDMEIGEDNKQHFVNDWATFSQALLWIMQNSTDSGAVTVAVNAVRASEMLNLDIREGSDD